MTLHAWVISLLLMFAKQHLIEYYISFLIEYSGETDAVRHLLWNRFMFGEQKTKIGS